MQKRPILYLIFLKKCSPLGNKLPFSMAFIIQGTPTIAILSYSFAFSRIDNDGEFAYFVPPVLYKSFTLSTKTGSGFHKSFECCTARIASTILFVNKYSNSEETTPPS